MAGTVYAIGLTLMVVATAVVSWRCYEKPGLPRFVFAVLGAVLILLGAAVSLHGCDAGQPLMQWALPMCCLMMATLLVGPPRIAIVIALLAGATAVLGSFHYASVVHGPDWVGNEESKTLNSPASSEWHTPISGLYRRSAEAVRAP